MWTGLRWLLDLWLILVGTKSPGGELSLWSGLQGVGASHTSLPVCHVMALRSPHWLSFSTWWIPAYSHPESFLQVSPPQAGPGAVPTTTYMHFYFSHFFLIVTVLDNFVGTASPWSGALCKSLGGEPNRSCPLWAIRECQSHTLHFVIHLCYELWKLLDVLVSQHGSETPLPEPVLEITGRVWWNKVHGSTWKRTELLPDAEG